MQEQILKTFKHVMHMSVDTSEDAEHGFVETRIREVIDELEFFDAIEK